MSEFYFVETAVKCQEEIISVNKMIYWQGRHIFITREIYSQAFRCFVQSLVRLKSSLFDLPNSEVRGLRGHFVSFLASINMRSLRIPNLTLYIPFPSKHIPAPGIKANRHVIHSPMTIKKYLLFHDRHLSLLSILNK